MDTVQILCILRNVKSVLGVFLSYLPHSNTRYGSVIINDDPQTERGSHWLPIHFEPRSSSAYYFNSNDIIPTIEAFLKRNCTVFDYNTAQLQGLTSTFCSQYCCLFALCMDRGYNPKQFVGLFNANIADRQIDQFFTSEFGPLRKEPRGDQCSSNIYERYVNNYSFTIFISNVDLNGGCHRLRILEGEPR